VDYAEVWKRRALAWRQRRVIGGVNQKNLMALKAAGHRLLRLEVACRVTLAAREVVDDEFALLLVADDGADGRVRGGGHVPAAVDAVLEPAADLFLARLAAGPPGAAQEEDGARTRADVGKDAACAGRSGVSAQRARRPEAETALYT